MSTIRLDSPSQSYSAQAVPTQAMAARLQQNSVTPQATDIRPPEAAEKLAKTTVNTKHGELIEETLDENGERRPPPPLREYARIPTRMTAEILRLQEEALEKADKAEADTSVAGTKAYQTATAEEIARISEASAAQSASLSTGMPQEAAQSSGAPGTEQKSPAFAGPNIASNLSAVTNVPEKAVHTLDYQA